MKNNAALPSKMIIYGIQRVMGGYHRGYPSGCGNVMGIFLATIYCLLFQMRDFNIIYIHIHYHIHIYTFTHVHIYIVHIYTYYTYTHIHIYTDTRIHIYPYTYKYTYTYRCIYIRMRICIHNRTL